MGYKRGGYIDALEIHEMAFGGKGIGYIEDDQGRMVVFVEQAIPGQLVKAQITEKRNRFMNCRLLAVLRRSVLETEMDYQHIAGNPYITLSLEQQLKWKEQVTIDVYRRLGKIENISAIYRGIISSPRPYHYRNKMEYSFGSIVHNPVNGGDYDGFALGFKARGTWWKVDPLLKDSGMFDSEWENHLHLISKVLYDTGLPAWHPPRKEGFFRFLVVSKSFAQNRLLVNLVTTSNGLEHFNASLVLNVVQQILGERLAGFIHTVNDSVSDRGKVEDGQSMLLYGKDFIEEAICGLNFRVSMESFFQPNPAAAEVLYNKVAEYVQQDIDYIAGEQVLDLFCGTGTIAQILAARLDGVKVTGVDIVEEAIQNARANAALNKLEHLQFHCADAGKYLHLHPEMAGRIKTVVVDPPRAGVGVKSMEKILNLQPERIVYVSCNPATQTRDIQQLIQAGFEFRALTLVDQFPHTHHIEAVALFHKIR